MLRATTLVLYGLVLAKAVRDHRRYPSPLLFFWMTFGVFLMPRIVLSMVWPELDLAQGTWMYLEVASDETVNQTLLLVCVFMAAFLLVPAPEPDGRTLPNDPVLTRLSLGLLVLMGPLAAFRGILIAREIAAKGYLATFTDQVSVPFFVNIGMALFQTAFYTLLASWPNKRSFAIGSAIYVAFSAFSLGSGQRTEFLTGILLVYWAGTFFGFFEFRFRSLAMLALPLISLSVLIDAWRLGGDVEAGVVRESVDFFWGQGSTLTVVFATLQHSAEFPPYEGWMFWNKFVSCDVLPMFTGRVCQNGDVVTAIPGIWWQKLSFIVDPDTFLAGGGMGGCIISAIYLFFNSPWLTLNILVFAIGSFVFFRICNALVSGLTRSRGASLYGIYFAHTLMFLPRAGLDSVIPHPRYLAAAAMIGALYLWYTRVRPPQVEGVQPG